MNSVYFDNSVKSRENIEMCLDEWKKDILDQFDKGEKITFHTHIEVSPCGDDVMVIGSSNMVSIGHFPDELKLR